MGFKVKMAIRRKARGEILTDATHQDKAEQWSINFSEG